ncbi:MAG: type II toxin-antitoxin system Phd/YefM family antitoxin [Cyanobacteria bacterium J06592_8]
MSLPQFYQLRLNSAPNPNFQPGEPLTIIQDGIPFAILTPIKKKSLLQTLSTLEPLDEDFPDVNEGL